MKITFFTGSVVGYVDNPSAIFTRGLAHGLSLRGNEVRVVEERQNQAYANTLRAVGSGAARHVHESFRTFQHHTYEARKGAQLLEWVTREISLIDAAVAIDDVQPELCRWLANVERVGLVRAYVTFDAESLTDQVVETLELERFDVILSPAQPAANISWQPIALAIAGEDQPFVQAAAIPEAYAEDADPIRAAEVFESRLTRTPSSSTR